ncbi:MAG TPA: hypothetical protein VGD50_00350 [Candidatus Baltobacteraceae bacterium]
MKRLLSSFFALALFASLAAPVLAGPSMGSMMAAHHMCPMGSMWIKGYKKHNGTWVKGYCRKVHHHMM